MRSYPTCSRCCLEDVSTARLYCMCGSRIKVGTSLQASLVFRRDIQVALPYFCSHNPYIRIYKPHTNLRPSVPSKGSTYICAIQALLGMTNSRQKYKTTAVLSTVLLSVPSSLECGHAHQVQLLRYCCLLSCVAWNHGDFEVFSFRPLYDSCSPCVQIPRIHRCPMTEAFASACGAF